MVTPLLLAETPKGAEILRGVLPTYLEFDVRAGGELGSSVRLAASFILARERRAVVVIECPDENDRFYRKWLEGVREWVGTAGRMPVIVAASPDIETAAEDPEWVDRLVELLEPGMAVPSKPRR